MAGLPEIGGVWNLNQIGRRFSRARTHAAAVASFCGQERRDSKKNSNMVREMSSSVFLC